VNTLNTGQNVAKPIIHGLHSNRVLIVNNGVRHEFQNWGVEHAPEIDPSLADNINVLKGASTVRYGPDALGGVLVINPSPLDLLTPLNGEAALTGATNGRSLDGQIKIRKGFHKLAVEAQGAYTYQGDLHTPDYQLTNTGKRELSATLSARYHWKNFDFFAYYSHFNQELGILRGSVTGSLEDLANAIQSNTPQLTQSFSYQINNPRQVVNHDVLKFRSLYSSEKQSIEATYAIQFNHRLEYDVRRGTNNDRPAIDLELLTQSLDLEWKHAPISLWDGQIGLQLLYQDNNNLPGTNTVPFIPNYNNLRLGIYMIEAAQLNPFRLEWGLRYDFQNTSVRGREPDNDIYRDDLTFQNLTATVGILKQINDNSLFRSNLGTAWRPPNVSELYSFGKHSASIEYGLWRYTQQEDDQIVTDQVLDSNDKAAPSEVGIKWINTYEMLEEKYQWEITAYANLIQNYIYTTPAGITQTIRGAFPYFIYEQDDALLAGIDANLLYQHTPKLSSEFRGSFLWAKNLEQQDFFVGLPPASLNYQLLFELPDAGILKNQLLSVELSYTLRQFFAPRVITIDEILAAKTEERNLFAESSADFDLLPPPDGYFLAGLSWQADIYAFQVGVQVRNIFNARFRNYTDRLRYFSDERGRNVKLNLRYIF
jgi:iron complex outermembrane receptor protein